MSSSKSTFINLSSTRLLFERLFDDKLELLLKITSNLDNQYSLKFALAR